MAALDFPASPSTGDRYPIPAVAGKPQYSWDGEKWTTAFSSTTTAPPATVPPLIDGTAAIGTSIAYAREDHVHPSDVDARGVRFDTAQTLTSAQKTQARQNIYAAPLDALAYSGMQINGSMEVSQEKGIGGWVANNGFAADGWQLLSGGTGVVNAGAYAFPAYVPGFTNWLVANTGTAQATINAADYFMVWQKIEGYRIARLGWGTASAKPITIGFWSKHTVPGIYSVTVRNSPVVRGYAATYTHAISNVPQYNVITIPGDTGGTWAVDNTPGMLLTFAIAMGSSNIASAVNTWIATPCAAAPGQVNGMSSTSNGFNITGVVVLPGIEAPSAERSPLIMRPYDQELLTCKRYWQKTTVFNRYQFTSAWASDVTGNFGMPFRATPTSLIVTPGARANVSSATVDNASIHGTFRHNMNSVGAGDTYCLNDTVTGDARL